MSTVEAHRKVGFLGDSMYDVIDEEEREKWEFLRQDYIARIRRKSHADHSPPPRPERTLHLCSKCGNWFYTTPTGPFLCERVNPRTEQPCGGIMEECTSSITVIEKVKQYLFPKFKRPRFVQEDASEHAPQVS